MLITLVFGIIGIANIIFQTVLLQSLPTWFGRPDLLFILIIFLAYRFAWIPGIVLVFSLSWMMDVVMSIHLGFYPLVYLFVFTIVKMIVTRNPVKENTYQIPLLGASYLISQFLLYIIFSFGLDQMMPDWHWGRRVQDTFIMMIVAIPVIALYNMLYNYLEERKQRSRPSRRSARKSRRPYNSLE